LLIPPFVGPPGGDPHFRDRPLGAVFERQVPRTLVSSCTPFNAFCGEGPFHCRHVALDPAAKPPDGSAGAHGRSSAPSRTLTDRERQVLGDDVAAQYPRLRGQGDPVASAQTAAYVDQAGYGHD
jgi:hypothetical protein